MKIVFLAPYPRGTAPSQRFRFEQYFGVLNEEKIHYSYYSFYSKWAYNTLYNENQKTKKILGVLSGYVLRFYHLLKCIRSDRIFIHRELSPLGPPVFEWILIEILRKKVIYDFDDAIWLSDKLPKNKWLNCLKWYPKVGFLCKRSHMVSTGNEYLAEYALQYNPNVIINPTTIDLAVTGEIKVGSTPPIVTIGWTGSHSTLKYLELVLTQLKTILKKNEFSKLLIVCNQKPDWEIEGMEFRYWDEETEWENIGSMDIGIMPLVDDPWANGKCGLKILQYFSLGIPALASPVGINRELIIPGENGFLCHNEDDWENYLNKLIQNPSLRESMGTAGKNLVEYHYSLNTNRDNFLRLLK
jgi:glycosyltransferase involved in cell wall biosynthesis